MRERGFASIVLLIVTVFAIIGFAIFKMNNLGRSLITSASPSPVPISEWKTYVEDSGKYTFKYPPDFDFKDVGYIWIGAAVGGFDLESKTNKNEYIDFGILDTKLPDFKNYYLNDTNIHKSTRNGYTTTEFEGFDKLKNTPIYTIVFSSDNLIYTFTSPKQMMVTLEQVVSTFTFLR